MIFPYYSQLTSISKITHYYTKELLQDGAMKELFGESFQIAHKLDKNLSEVLCRAK